MLVLFARHAGAIQTNNATRSFLLSCRIPDWKTVLDPLRRILVLYDGSGKLPGSIVICRFDPRFLTWNFGPEHTLSITDAARPVARSSEPSFGTDYPKKVPAPYLAQGGRT
jgi:hypothetical protein